MSPVCIEDVLALLALIIDNQCTNLTSSLPAANTLSQYHTRTVRVVLVCSTHVPLTQCVCDTVRVYLQQPAGQLHTMHDAIAHDAFANCYNVGNTCNGSSQPSVCSNKHNAAVATIMFGGCSACLSVAYRLAARTDRLPTAWYTLPVSQSHRASPACMLHTVVLVCCIHAIENCCNGLPEPQFAIACMQHTSTTQQLPPFWRQQCTSYCSYCKNRSLGARLIRARH
jgi:hypothetical protein